MSNDITDGVLCFSFFFYLHLIWCRVCVCDIVYEKKRKISGRPIGLFHSMRILCQENLVRKIHMSMFIQP